jgi:hypothetical protein
VIGIGYTANGLHVTSDAGSRAVARFWSLCIAIDLVKHSVVGIAAERLFYGLQVRLVGVCRDLRASRDDGLSDFLPIGSVTVVTVPSRLNKKISRFASYSSS